MDKNITMRSTKTEMFAHIGHLEQRLREGGKAMDELRHRISVLEGTQQLQQPAPQPERIVRMNGVDYRVVVERTGPSTRKRFVPVV